MVRKRPPHRAQSASRTVNPSQLELDLDPDVVLDPVPVPTHECHGAEAATAHAALKDVASPPVPGAVVILDPGLVCTPDMPNREKSVPLRLKLDELCKSIAAIGYNVSPIGVSVAFDSDGKTIYELVYGERRVFACSAVSVKVRAVIAPATTIVGKALERISENTARLDLAHLELGHQAKYILDTTPGLL